MFERSVKRGAVVFVADDGERLRSLEAVQSYLLKCGLDKVLSSALAQFDFEDAPSDKSPSKPVEDPPSDKSPSKSTDGAAGGVGGAPDSKGKTVMKRKRKEEDAKKDTEQAEEEPEWKARNRKIAQSRAAAFARGKGYEPQMNTCGRGRG